MLNSMAQQEQQTDFTTAILLGTVVNNLDPEKAERLQVTIKGLIEGPVSTLPWVMPCRPRTSAVGIDVPSVGDQVYIMLQNGDIHYPVWIGRHLRVNALPVELSTNYPNRYGWKDTAGNVFYVDKTPGSVKIYVKHKSGTTIEIVESGDLTATVVANLTAAVTGNISGTAGGNLSMTAGGTGTVHATGNLTLSTDANLTLSASNLDFNITGTSTFTGGGTVNLP